MYNILYLRFNKNDDKNMIYKKLNNYIVDVYEYENEEYLIVKLILDDLFVFNSNFINNINPINFILYQQRDLRTLEYCKEIDTRKYY